MPHCGILNKVVTVIFKSTPCAELSLWIFCAALMSQLSCSELDPPSYNLIKITSE